MLSFEHKLRVEYHHTDQMGIVHHSNYIKFFEAARTEWLRAAGLTYAEMERRGVMMPIVDVQIKYRQPAYYDEMLSITTSVRELPMARMTFYYEVRGEDGRDVASGMTTLGFIDSVTRRPQRVPQWLMEVLERM
ncbi:MAG: acyl-CoA thioesterase [Alistipes sp.]|jgi:acyl-CoA thioester hydrolase|nr:acyl-CoA thioesterase [Alistipes sp.]MBO7261785.1 acyl-CoA thioesterase [Alistipes sp.]